MCAKKQRRCPELLAIRAEALEEWTGAETFEEVRACWARLACCAVLRADPLSGSGSRIGQGREQPKLPW